MQSYNNNTSETKLQSNNNNAKQKKCKVTIMQKIAKLQ